MPHGQTKFRAEWLTAVDKNGDTMADYIVPGDDVYHAKCVLCNKTVQVRHDEH